MPSVRSSSRMRFRLEARGRARSRPDCDFSEALTRSRAAQSNKARASTSATPVIKGRATPAVGTQLLVKSEQSPGTWSGQSCSAGSKVRRLTRRWREAQLLPCDQLGRLRPGVELRHHLKGNPEISCDADQVVPAPGDVDPAIWRVRALLEQCVAIGTWARRRRRGRRGRRGRARCRGGGRRRFSARSRPGRRCSRRRRTGAPASRRLRRRAPTRCGRGDSSLRAPTGSRR